ncbi:MAG: tetratricopeptide repeat protein [Roseivirga sp.]|nr:tetratricopeptide repeat protein [Roseivirga sp.]
MRYVIAILLTTLFNSGYPQDLISVANSFLNDKNYHEAKEAIDEVFLKPEMAENARAWYTKGRIYHEILKNDAPDLDKFKVRIDQFVNQIIEAYDKTQSLTGRGNNLFILANNQKQLLWAESMNKGYDHFQNQKYPEAVRSFDIAKIVQPRDTTALLYAGVSAQQAGFYQVAIDNYTAMKKLTPLSRNVYRSMIICHQAKRSTLETQLDVVEDAIFNYPDHVPYIIEESRILVRQGRFEEAESRLKTVVNRNPKAHDLRLLKADLYDRMFREAYMNGRPERSIEYFDLASIDYELFIEAFPTHFKANHNYAVMINERANRYYVRANLLNEEEYQISGKETEELGHKWTRKALPYMERALSINPNDKDALKALRAFYQRLKLDEKLALLNNR